MWVHFYEDDVAFERLWSNPNKYLPILKRYGGGLTPDFSLYRDMPLVMQHWNIYRSRAIGFWLQENGIPIIVNIRYGDERTYAVSCLGAPRNCSFVIGTHGCIKRAKDREYFTTGLEYAVSVLSPKTIIVYGAAPDAIFGKYIDLGIRVLQFDSDFAMTHRKKETL